MSLTEAEQVFGGVAEQAINDLFTAFFSARPLAITSTLACMM